jgi:hypothetical protein
MSASVDGDRGDSDLCESELSPELQLADPDLFVEEVEVNLVRAPVPDADMVVPTASGGPSDFVVTPDPTSFLGAAVGHVHERLDFWTKKLEADKYVLNIVREGYKIPVFPGTKKIVYREANNRSARLEPDFVKSEVARLLEAGLVVKCDTVPLCCNPLSVAFKANYDGLFKRRLVLDLSRHVNKLIPDSKCCMTMFGE